MNPNDLPLKEKLAALIEAGRAANPNMRHLHGAWGDLETSGCAMTFAFKAAGVTGMGELAEHMGASLVELDSLARGVIDMNDEQRATIPEIVNAIRTETLPQKKRREAGLLISGSFLTVNLDYAAAVKYLEEAGQNMKQAIADSKISIGYFGDYSKAFEVSVMKPLAEKYIDETLAKVCRPKGVRTSAKTGATWPKPKHCYA